jgi:alginate O-acetyltransferase complex protein AlgI
MLFNSLEFLLFFPAVTVLYFLIPYKYRWILLLAASCFFYMAFIPYYILILAATILIDYFAAIFIENSTGRKRKLYLIVSIISTCLVLFVFKYYNFFIGNFNSISKAVDWNYSLNALSILLPIGLSFHTFQSLSYVIEVYRGKFKAERHFGIYSLYVMFYPQLVAGPIERPQNILPQLHGHNDFNYNNAREGLLLMLQGFFKKLVIADRLAVFANLVYNNPQDYHGFEVIVATIFFAIQIYCDFSGYSDIAIGSAKVMGYNLMKNFDKPYFAKSISEFWKRWHISLSTWFKDYVYVPLGGNRVSKWRWFFNLFFTFMISGFWHGANWTFIIWGALHGFYLIFAIVLQDVRNRLNRWLGLIQFPRLLSGLQIFTTFVLVTFAWIFFRANSLSDAMLIIRNMGDLSWSQLRFPMYDRLYLTEFPLALIFIALLFFTQYLQRTTKLREAINERPPAVRLGLYALIINVIIFFGVFNESSFIYFQF